MKRKAKERAKRKVQPHEVVRMMVAGSRGIEVGHAVEQGEGIYLVTLDMKKEMYWNVELENRNVWFTLPWCSIFLDANTWVNATSPKTSLGVLVSLVCRSFAAKCNAGVVARLVFETS